MKINDLIPGNQITNKDINSIVKKIKETLNPNCLSPLELWSNLMVISVEEVTENIKKCLSDKFYLVYTFYLKKECHRLFLLNKSDVIKFISDNFNEELEYGMDIMISDIKYEKVIIGNHNGVLAILSD